jgi:hypothetical protein
MRELKKAVKGMTWKPSTSADVEREATFLLSFEMRIATDGGTISDMLQLIGQHLTGDAIQWYQTPLGATLQSWERFKADII